MPAQSFDFRKRLKDIGLFFAGQDEVHKTMRRLARRLKQANIAYAIVGGMAANAHGHHQTTSDVDVLLTADSLAEFRERFVPARYQLRPERTRRFVDCKNDIGVDVLVTGSFPHGHRAVPVAYPDPAEVRQNINGIQVVQLLTLLTLKLAAGRFGDLGDVAALIRCNDLDESVMDNLHPSLHINYMKCLDEKRREDEYEARDN